MKREAQNSYIVIKKIKILNYSHLYYKVIELIEFSNKSSFDHKKKSSNLWDLKVGHSRRGNKILNWKEKKKKKSGIHFAIIVVESWKCANQSNSFIDLSIWSSVYCFKFQYCILIYCVFLWLFIKKKWCVCSNIISV